MVLLQEELPRSKGPLVTRAWLAMHNNGPLSDIQDWVNITQVISEPTYKATMYASLRRQKMARLVMFREENNPMETDSKGILCLNPISATVFSKIQLKQWYILVKQTKARLRDALEQL